MNDDYLWDKTGEPDPQVVTMQPSLTDAMNFHLRQVSAAIR